ncbi:MAG: hypothetical protein AAB791_02855, partial [Patescibacteria group bacterium]
MDLENGKVKNFAFNSNLEKNLLPGEGMTIVAGFPKGIVHQPTLWENFLETLKDNFVLFLPLVCLLIMLSLWLTRGRDPKGKGTVVAQY